MKSKRQNLLATFLVASMAATSTASAAVDASRPKHIKNVLNNGVHETVNIVDEMNLKNQLEINSDLTIKSTEKNKYSNAFSPKNRLKETGIKVNDSTLTIESIVFNNFKHGALETAADSVIRTKKASFVDNVSKGDGAAIYNASTSDEQSLIRDSVFMRNESKGNGGAVYNALGTMEYNDVLFRENIAKKGNGGAINNDSNGHTRLIWSLLDYNKAKENGGAINNKGELFVHSTTLNNNVAKKGTGGAINNTGFLTVEESTFKNNKAKGNGGAINSISNDVLTVRDTKFINNVSKEGNGGAIAAEGTTYVIRSNFEGNKAQNGGAIYNRNGYVESKNSNFTNNTAKKYGGAIYSSSASRLNVLGGNFYGNSAVNAGGAILNYGYADNIIGNFTQNYLKNDGSAYGGAIANSGSKAIVEFIGGTFNDNFVKTNNGYASGGAIANYTAGAVIEKIEANFTNNHTKTTSTYAAKGGAIYNLAEISDITGVFSYNYTKSDGLSQGGAIYNATFSYGDTKGYVKISDSTFNKNGIRMSDDKIMTKQGGAIYNYREGAIVEIEGTRFIENAATVAGGALYNQDGTFNINESIFYKNKTKGDGGAIYNEGLSIDERSMIIDTVFRGNSARDNGGAIYNEIGSIELQGSVFRDNIAKNGAGGAIYADKDAETRLFGSIFNGNKAKLDGGAIDNAGNLVVGSLGDGEVYSIFRNNVSKDGSGGAIHNTGDLYVQETIFNGNEAKVNGGAINNYFTSGLTIRDSIFKDNTAKEGYGGAIYNAATTTHILGSTFRGNESNINGGAIHQRSGYLNITSSDISDNRSVFTDNVAKERGGAISSSVTSRLNIEDVLFARNTAGSEGGAINNYGAADNITGTFIENSVISKGSGYGGAIATSGDKAKVEYMGGLFKGNFVKTENGYAFGGALSNHANEAVIKELNANFVNNYAKSSSAYAARGGAIYNIAEISEITGLFSHNYTKSDGMSQGGAVYNGYSSYYGTTGVLSFVDSVFRENGRRESDDKIMTKQGGAIYNDKGGKINITSSYFIDNAATSAGGAIYNAAGWMEIQRSVFNGNVAKKGAGGAINTAIDAETRLFGSVFNGNEAKLDGGAINNDGKTTIGSLGNGETLSIFRNNTSRKGSGGAINNTGDLYIQDTIFADNKAKLDGGAINNVSDESLTIRRAFFNGNVSRKGNGGAINNTGSTYLVDTSFINNQAKNGLGGAIANSGYLSIMAEDENVIFKGNTDERGQSNAIHNFETGRINLLADAGKIIEFHDAITGSGTMSIGDANHSGRITLNADTSEYTGAVTLNNGILKLDRYFDGETNIFSDFTTYGGRVNVANGYINKIDTSSWKVNGTLNVVLDVNLRTAEADYFSGIGSKALEISKIEIKDTRNGANGAIDVYVTDKNNAMTITKSGSTAYGQVFAYDVTSDKLQSEGLLTFNKGDAYNPVVLKVSAANNSHLINLTGAMHETFSPNRMPVAAMPNLASGDESTSPFVSAWVESYYASDDIDLGGTEIDSDSYFTIIGGDIQGRNFGSWTSLYSIYTGYMGSQQKQDGYDINQNGMVVGGSMTLENDNVYTVFNTNVSTSFASSKTDTGDDNFNIYSFSIANKTGAKFDVTDRLLKLEPSLIAGYHYIHTEDYRTSNGVDMKSDGLSIFNIMPEVKLTLDFGSVKPYVAAGYNWNMDAGGDVKANGILLPNLSVDKYAEFKLGTEFKFNNVDAFVEGQATTGDRDGYGAQIGIKFNF